MVTPVALQDSLGRGLTRYYLFAPVSERALANIALDRCVGVSWSLHFLVLVRGGWVSLDQLTQLGNPRLWRSGWYGVRFLLIADLGSLRVQV